MNQKVFNDFMQGLSVVGLARKYKMKSLQVENIIRKMIEVR